MKRKIKILLVSCIIASAAVTGFNQAQENRKMDVSLADIAVMARADGESGSACYDQLYMITYIGDGCDYTVIETHDCIEGSQHTICSQGFDGTDYFCDGPPRFWSTVTSLSC